MTLGGFATGLLVESHEGRPTKIEGNPQHPASLGATNAFPQAAILGLYDPDRARAVTYRGQPRGWGDVVEELRNRLHPSSRPGHGQRARHSLRDGRLAHARCSTERISRRIIPRRSGSSTSRSTATTSRPARSLAFGKAQHVYHKLSEGRDHCRARRRLPRRRPGTSRLHARVRLAQTGEPAGKKGMNRLYCVETELTITGAPGRSSPARCGRHRSRRLPAPWRRNWALPEREAAKLDDEAARWVEVVAKDLQKRKAGATLVLAGDGQPAAVHAIVSRHQPQARQHRYAGQSAIDGDPHRAAVARSRRQHEVTGPA